MAFGGADSFITKVLSDKIAEKKTVGGIIILKPKEANFSELYITKRSVGFFEYKYSFTALVSMISREEMDENMAKAYRILKGYECTLSSSGIFRKKLFFVSRKELDSFKDLEGFKISDRVVRILNKDKELLTMISKLGIPEISIILRSVFKTYLPFITDKERLIKAEKAYYNDPAEIVWTPFLSMLLTRGIRFKRNVIYIYDVLDRISGVLKKVSSEIIEQFKGDVSNGQKN